MHETWVGLLITQRSEVQILPPLRRIALRRKPFLIGRAYVMLRTVTKGVVIARLGGGPWAQRSGTVGTA
jgi:hypothetical protein